MIDINTATQEELAALPGVGPDLAVDIVAYRDASGPFASLDDIANIPGCNEETVMRLREAGADVVAFAADDGSGTDI